MYPFVTWHTPHADLSPTIWAGDLPILLAGIGTTVDTGSGFTELIDSGPVSIAIPRVLSFIHVFSKAEAKATEAKRPYQQIDGP